MYEQNTVNRLYKKLLNLYPRAFKERLGESMQQTFNDLCKEWQADRGWFVFVLWTFAETTAGIMKEHTLLVAEGVAMKNMHANPQIRTPGSIILCLPAAIILFIDMVALGSQ